MSSPDDQDRSRAETYAEFAALVGGLAHEIRNPLSTIRLNMELLAEDFENTDTESPIKQRERRGRGRTGPGWAEGAQPQQGATRMPAS